MNEDSGKEGQEKGKGVEDENKNGEMGILSVKP